MFLTQEYYKTVKIPVPLEMIEAETIKYLIDIYLFLYMRDSCPYKTMITINKICDEIRIFEQEQNKYRKNKKVIECLKWLQENGYIEIYEFDYKTSTKCFEYRIKEKKIFEEGNKHFLISAGEYINYIDSVCLKGCGEVSIDILSKVYFEMRYLSIVWSHNSNLKISGAWCGNLKSVSYRLGVSHVSVTRAIKHLYSIGLLYVLYGVFNENKKRAATIVIDVCSCSSVIDTSIKVKEFLAKNNHLIGWYIPQ